MANNIAEQAETARINFTRRGTFAAVVIGGDTCADWRGATKELVNFLFHDGDRARTIWLPSDSPSIAWGAA